MRNIARRETATHSRLCWRGFPWNQIRDFVWPGVFTRCTIMLCDSHDQWVGFTLSGQSNRSSREM